MNPPIEDIKDHMIAASSALGLDFPTDLFIAKQPDVPDLCVTLFDTGGFEPHANFRYDKPTIQAYIRGNQGGYLEAYALAEDVKEFIRTIKGETINSTKYIGIWAMQDVFFIGYDKKDRPTFSVNFRIHRTTT